MIPNHLPLLPPRTLQHIEYAKTKSHATLRREDPDFVPPTSVHAKNAPRGQANGSAGEKRPRDDRANDDDARDVKRERTAGSDDDDDEEMEIEDDEEQQAGAASGARLVLYICGLCARVAHTMSVFVCLRPDTRSSPTAISSVNVPQPAARGHGRCAVGAFPAVRVSVIIGACRL